MDFTVIGQYAAPLLNGLLYSLVLSLIAALMALGFAALLTWTELRSSSRALKTAGRLYCDFILGLPLLVLIYVLFFILPEYGITLSSPAVGVTALSLYYGPYLAQVLGAAFASIPRGQFEACRVLGLSRWSTLRDVALQQALPVAIPPATGLLIGLVKDSALLSIVSVEEFMYAAKQAISQSYAPLEIYLAVALCYWLVTLAIDAAAGSVERRLTRHRPA
ncbi:amino acid ABC transporter permease [Phytopseudomonas punonensis]|uniref:Polar amino acid transport system permease protein n=1 Tax=Phytopseudomonas punonensis TaxID=1220495 RepID=A0A1M7FN69_9GAMM|nr:amino acid ABC transporter permease [Pseudomonas punonensis]SHM05494.1 polar amino acid transport system permease protein [Pseudomonas punonensis]